MATPPRISLAWSHLNKSLPLRAILFDARAIMRSPLENPDPNAPKRRSANLEIRRPEKMVADGNVKDMLRSEIRDELTKRGLSAVGKPWEIKERLETSILADVNRELKVPSMPPPPAEAAPPPPSAPPSAASSSPELAASLQQPAASAAEKRAAYAAKLRSRTGGSILTDGTIVSNTTTPGGARPLARHERPADEAASWHMQPGARELLTYCDMRNIYRCLLPADVDSDEAAQAQAARLSKALQVPDFLHVLSLEEAESVRKGEHSAVAATLAALELEKSSNLMIVSDEGPVLKAAKAARVFSCFFIKRLPGAPISRP